MKIEDTKLEHLSVVGPIKRSEKKLIAEAVEFYADLLFSKQLKSRTTIIVEFVKKLSKDYEGECEIIGYGRKNKPRHFVVRVVYKNTSLSKILRVIAHEMVHAKQFALGETDDQLTTWMGERIPENTNYWDHPWEIDAFGRQEGLITRFVKYKKL
jgi:hypothetical protein